MKRDDNDDKTTWSLSLSYVYTRLTTVNDSSKSRSYVAFSRKLHYSEAKLRNVQSSFKRVSVRVGDNKYVPCVFVTISIIS